MPFPLDGAGTCPYAHAMPSLRLDYVGASRDADRRMEAGQRQRWCPACGRYRWDDESGLCRLAEMVDERPRSPAS